MSVQFYLMSTAMQVHRSENKVWISIAKSESHCATKYNWEKSLKVKLKLDEVIMISETIKAFISDGFTGYQEMIRKFNIKVKNKATNKSELAKDLQFYHSHEQVSPSNLGLEFNNNQLSFMIIRDKEKKSYFLSYLDLFKFYRYLDHLVNEIFLLSDKWSSSSEINYKPSLYEINSDPESIYMSPKQAVDLLNSINDIDSLREFRLTQDHKYFWKHADYLEYRVMFKEKVEYFRNKK